MRVSATTTGTGNFSLGAAIGTGRTFAAVCANADTVHYAIHHTSAAEFEVGLGTYTSAGDILVRTTPLESSNGGAAVNFSAGTKNVELVLPGLLVRQIYALQALTGVVRVDAGVLSADTDVTDIVAAASETVAGKIEIATTAEVNTGTDNTRAVSPQGLTAWTGDSALVTVGTVTAGNVDAVVSAASETVAGKIEIATTAEVNTGSDNTRAVSPAGLTAWTGDTALVTVGTLATGNADAIVSASSTTVQGKIEAATTTEQLTGTDAARAATPDSVAALWEAGADNADGATITMGEGRVFNLITSTTTITAFAFTTDKAGRQALIRFNTSRQVTHNATTLISPTGGNLLFQQGDQMGIVSLGGGNFRIVSVRKADVATGEGLGGVTSILANVAATNATTNLSCVTFTIPVGTLRVGSVYRYTGRFVFVHTAATTPTLTAEFLINGVVVDTAVMTPAASAASFDGTVETLITCRTTGASGTVMVNTRFDTNAAGAVADGSANTATDVVDTTVARTTELRIRMTTAVPSNTVTVTQGFVEKVF